MKKIIKEQTTTNINKLPDWPNKAIHYNGETANLYSDPENKNFIKQIRFDKVAVKDNGTIEIKTSGESIPLNYYCNKPNVIFGYYFKDVAKKPKEILEFYSNKLTPKLQRDFCTKNSTGVSVPKGTYTSAKTQTTNLAENKKPIRLTEADLVNLVKKVIQEQGVKDPSTDIVRLKAERERLKKELARLEAQIASLPKEGGKRVHDMMVKDCLMKAGFKVGNTSGKYDLYMFKETQSSIGSVTYVVTSQQDPTIFATHTHINGKSTTSSSFQIGTSTNCQEIVRKSTM